MNFFILILLSLVGIQCFALNVKDIRPPLPPFWEIATLNGVDSDKDGVRDDVEIWINETYKDYNLNMALKKIANSYKRLNDALDIKKDFLIEKSRFDIRNYCWKFVSLNLSINPLEVTHKLQEKVLNTPIRVYFFKKGFSNLPSGITTMPSVPRHLHGTACEFTIKEPRKIFEEFLRRNPHYEWGYKQQKEFKELYEAKSLVLDPYVLFRMEHRRL